MPSDAPSPQEPTSQDLTSHTSGPVGDRRVGWLLVLVLVLAALLRLTYLLEVTRAPDFASPRFESLYHDYWARALLSDDWTPPAGVTDPEIPDRPYFRPPGYPYFLAATLAVGGGTPLAPRLVQMLLGLLSCGLLFSLGRRCFGPWAGLAASTLMGVAWVPLFFEGELMAPPLLMVLLLAHLEVLTRWREALGRRASSGLAGLAGLLLGIGALVRPNLLALAAPALVWMLWVLAREGIPWRWRWRPLLALTATLALAVAPATLRNGRVSDDPVLITSNAGINLFVGTHPDSDGYTPGVPELGALLGLTGWDSFDQPKIVAAVSAHEGRPMTDAEVSRWFSHRARAHLAEDPLAVVRQIGRKLLLFWGPAEISNNKVLALERRVSPTLGLGLGFASLFALALAGLVALGAERNGPTGPGRTTAWEGAALMLATILTLCASYLPFFVSARFRVPVVPLLALLGGVALATLGRLVTQGRWRTLAVGVVLFAVLRGLTGIAWIPYEPDEALWHLRRGLLLREQQRFGEAADAFGAVLGVDPKHADAPVLLGETLAAGGRSAEAVAVYRRALVDQADSPVLHNNLALLLAQGGDLDGAIDHWRQTLALDPDRVPALVNLAGTLATHPDPARRDPETAVQLAEHAAQLTNRDPAVLRILATAYQAAGRDDDAQAVLDGLR